MSAFALLALTINCIIKAIALASAQLQLVQNKYNQFTLLPNTHTNKAGIASNSMYFRMIGLCSKGGRIYPVYLRSDCTHNTVT